MQLPVCELHAMTNEQAASRLIRLPALVIGFLLAGYAVVYLVGVLLGLIDWLNGLLFFAFAMVALPVYLFAIIYIAARRTRYGVLRSDNQIELWHCSDQFCDAVEHRKTLRDENR